MTGLQLKDLCLPESIAMLNRHLARAASLLAQRFNTRHLAAPISARDTAGA